MFSRIAIYAGIEIINYSIIQQLLKEQRVQKKQKERRKRNVWVRGWISRRKDLGASDTLLVEWSLEDSDYFKKRLRMTTDQFNTLLHKVTPLIQKCDTNMRVALSPKIKLEITLKFLATGDNYSSLAERNTFMRRAIACN